MSIGSASAPRDLLRSRGWKLSNPLEITPDAWSYQRFIQDSKAEFGIAKHGYASTRCGWFSERSAGYLASGRPVLAQETGFSDWLPTGSGLLAFSNAEEVLAGIREIDARYEHHCQAARGIIEDHFDAAKVLPDLLAKAMSASANRAF